jgi:pentatricopeptide repeat protein
MPEHDAISWNSMISGYVLHGYCKEGMQLFEKMQHEGVIPDQREMSYHGMS